jgi:ribosomal protein L34E
MSFDTTVPIQWLNTRCPRCGEAFHCGVADGAPCQCAAVPLPNRVCDHLRANYSGCLCCGCLREVVAEQREDGSAA